MDVMTLRRMLMATGGVNVAVGDFSKYEKKTLTFPNAADTSTWETGAIIPCSFEPKLVVFYGGASVAGNIVNGVFALTISDESLGVGGVKVKNASGVTTQYVYYLNPNASSQRFKYESGYFYAQRAASGVYWSNTDSYTFEIYG